MISITDIKQKARSQLKGYYGVLFLCYLISFLLSAQIGTLSETLANLITPSRIFFETVDIYELVKSIVTLIITSITSVLITGPTSVSFALIYLGLIAGEKPSVADLFKGFTVWLKSVKVSFVLGLIIYLWCLLFMGPGIFLAVITNNDAPLLLMFIGAIIASIKVLSYSLVFYILAENKEMGVMEIINESKRMMQGNKMDLFLLTLSFIGWVILCVFTVGIGFIWIGPYIAAANANFYNELKDEPIVNSGIIVVDLEAEKKALTDKEES